MNALALQLDSPMLASRVRAFLSHRRITVFTAAIALILGTMPFLETAFQLTPETLMQGRVWTVLTAPLLHVSSEHLLLDVLGLLVVGCVFEPMFGARRWLMIIVAVNIAVGLSIFTAYPHLHEFRGLSALDQGLMAAGAVALWMRRDRAAGLIVGLTLIGKWTMELSSGESTAHQFLGAALNFGQAVPWAHVIGGAAGAFAAFVSLRPGAADDAVPATTHPAHAS